MPFLKIPFYYRKLYFYCCRWWWDIWRSKNTEIILSSTFSSAPKMPMQLKWPQLLYTVVPLYHIVFTKEYSWPQPVNQGIYRFITLICADAGSIYCSPILLLLILFTIKFEAIVITITAITLKMTLKYCIIISLCSQAPFFGHG